MTSDQGRNRDRASEVPVGSLYFQPGVDLGPEPDGWMELDGRELDQQEDPELCDVMKRAAEDQWLADRLPKGRRGRDPSKIYLYDLRGEPGRGPGSSPPSIAVLYASMPGRYLIKAR